MSRKPIEPVEITNLGPDDIELGIMVDECLCPVVRLVPEQSIKGRFNQELMRVKSCGDNQAQIQITPLEYWPEGLFEKSNAQTN